MAEFLLHNNIPQQSIKHHDFALFSVNPGMEHSDSDSFQEVLQMGPRSQNNDQSRSNSLMSETSSQPDIHPFYKVRPVLNFKSNRYLRLKVLFDE